MEINDEILKELFPEFKPQLDDEFMKQMSVLYLMKNLNIDLKNIASEILFYPYDEHTRHVLFEKYTSKSGWSYDMDFENKK